MNKFLILVILIFIFVFWIFWLPGDRVANDYHLPHITPAYEKSFPWIWRETNVADGLGEYTGITLWAQPLHSILTFLSVINISPDLQTKLLGILIFISGFYSLSKLLEYFTISSYGKYLGIFFYLTNTYFLLLFDGGQLSVALVYAITPLLVSLYLRSIKNSLFKYKLYLALIFLIVSILDIRFVYLLGMLFLLILVFQMIFESKQRLKIFTNSLISASLVAVLLVLFHAYWLLPSIIIKAPELPTTYARTNQVDFLSFSSLGHTLLLQQPNWYSNIFGQVSNLKFDFILIPILVFIAPMVQKKSKTVGLWLMIAAFGIFLSKGSQQPLGQIYIWLFTNIPGFSLFRDASKFFIFIALSYSILMAITINAIISKKSLFRLLPYLLLIYFLWILRPVYLVQMTGLFSKPIFAAEFEQFAEYLSRDSKFSRVFWVPTKAPLGYASNIHPPTEAARFALKRPFATGISGSYETFNYLRDASYMGELFDIAGIGYIAYPYLDPRRDDMYPDNIRYYSLFFNQLSKLPWLTKVENSGILALKTLRHEDRFFATSNVWWVIGSDDIYPEATKGAALHLFNNALIFSEEYPNFGKKLDQLPNAKIVLNKKTKVDLAASFINPSNLIFPALDLNFNPDQSGWWKREAVDLSQWRNFLVTKYGIDNQDFDLGGGWAVGENNLTLQLNTKRFNLVAGNMLLVRVMESSRSGSLSVYQDGELLGEIKTQSNNGANIRWFEVGPLLKNGGNLMIKTNGAINVINALAILDKNTWKSYLEKSDSLLQRVVDFNVKNAQPDDNPQISYRKINPTKYLLRVINLKVPTFVIFSENYDPLWRLNNQSALPVYSLLNGFRIDRDGEFIIEYEAQKYVYLGLAISVITTILLIFLIYQFSKRN